MNSQPGFVIQEISGEKGKGIFATKQFQPGEVVFEEKPIVSAQFAWNKDYKYLACDHCLRPLETTQENVKRLTGDTSLVLPLPELCPTDKSKQNKCSDCGISYCSSECMDEASKQYHELLCQFREPLGPLYKAWMSMHYPPETTSIELILRIIAYVEQSEDKGSKLAELMQFSHSAVDVRTDTVMKLLGEDFVSNISTIQSLLSKSIPMTHTAHFGTEEGLKTLFGLVGRNGQGIGTSVFSRWVKAATEFSEKNPAEKPAIDVFIDAVYEKMEEEVGCFLNTEGSGLYWLQHFINHSCVPNAIVAFPKGDHTLQVVAETEIHPGDEICISYLDEFDLSRSRHSRNKLLREYYLFTCFCPKCLASTDETDVTSEEEEES